MLCCIHQHGALLYPSEQNPELPPLTLHAEQVCGVHGAQLDAHQHLALHADGKSYGIVLSNFLLLFRTSGRASMATMPVYAPFKGCLYAS